MFLRRLYGGGAAADSAPTRSAWLDSIQLNPAVRGYSAAQSEIFFFFARSRSRFRSSPRDDDLDGDVSGMDVASESWQSWEDAWPVANWACHFLSAAGKSEDLFQASLSQPLVF